jgi:hypothetical protein
MENLSEIAKIPSLCIEAYEILIKASYLHGIFLATFNTSKLTLLNGKPTSNFICVKNRIMEIVLIIGANNGNHMYNFTDVDF